MTEKKKIIKVEDIKAKADKKVCPVERSLFYVSEFLAGPMCGRCFPCSMGCYEARNILYNIIEGSGIESDLLSLKRIADEMLISSMCKKGKDTARFIIEWLSTDVFHQHIEGICPDKICGAFIEFRIIPEKCTLCGICKDICKYNAIHGEKIKPFQSGYHPFEIRQAKCFKCGDCIRVGGMYICPEEAIVISDVKTGKPIGVI